MPSQMTFLTCSGAGNRTTEAIMVMMPTVADAGSESAGPRAVKRRSPTVPVVVRFAPQQSGDQEALR